MSLLVRAIPFLDGDEIAGVVVLVRDVTDLRRRDRHAVVEGRDDP